MDPEIVEMVRFLDPEIVEKVDKSFMILSSYWRPKNIMASYILLKIK